MTRTDRLPRLPLLAALLITLYTLSGCEALQVRDTPPVPSVSQLYARPAERAFINGLRFYEDGAFDRAENAFRTALGHGLADRRDAATAHKYLAFIACAFNRMNDCEHSFQSAFKADPEFRLQDAEVGHPIWGPVYRRVVQKNSPPPGATQPSNPSRSDGG